MDVNLPAGRYVIAVSGGVDSVTLLHLLAQRPGVELVVAHFDHGIREDSAEDRKLVQQLAKQYGLPFVRQAGKLGPRASEAAARKARYAFLHKAKQASGAQAIITAHHQDDMLETAILNLLRGTGRRGLGSLKSTDTVKRPLLPIPKSEIRAYAKEQGLVWREDSTNSDERYTRNYIRTKILPRFSAADRQALSGIIMKGHELNREIEAQLTNMLHAQPGTHKLDREQFILLPHNVAREVMGEWLLQRGRVELSRRLLERLVVAAKTGRSGSKVDVDAEHWLLVDRGTLALVPRER